MKICIVVFALCSLVYLSCEKKFLQTDTNLQDVLPASPIAGYTYAWSDEFDSLALDTFQWKYRVGLSGASFQRAENVSLEDGKLKIDLKRQTYQGVSLTGGGIITKTPFRYGYYEVSAKLDGGHGWHEAFWTAGQSGFDDPNPTYDETTGKLEIDCFEHYAEYDSHKFTYGAIEWEPVHGSINRDYVTTTEDLTADYNVFGFEYTPDYLNYYYNGALLKTVDMREAPDHDFYLWLSTIATATDATDSGEVYFDYVRCYTITAINYATRKIPFINYLDSLRGPQHSNGSDLWVQAEDFKHLANWTVERDIDNVIDVKGFAQYDAGRDSTALTAQTRIQVDSAGTYRLWVRSRDFGTAPGIRKFKVLVNGEEAPIEFGTHGTNGYAWQSGGTFYLTQGLNLLRLYDSSQYFARCDKLLLTSDTTFVPEGIGGIANVMHTD